MDTTVHIGYLTAKLIENTPEFKLYQSSKEFLVKTLIISDNYQLEESDLDLLQNVNEIIFVDFLKILNIEFDYENSVHGGLIVILKKDLNDLFEIDWDTIKIENLKKENFYDYHAKHPEVETEELLVRIIADIDALKAYYRQGFKVSGIPKTPHVETIAKDDLIKKC